MNINDLTNELNSLENNEQSLNEQINQLETERLSREQSQFRLVGQQPAPVPKSEEQVRLEQERDNVIVNKNRIINIISSYRQLQTAASNSEYNGYSIQDFEQMRDNFDSSRKELAERIQALESDRLSREQSQLRTVGQEPAPVPKSEEQVKLEQEKLEAEQGFQKTVNIIGLYNRFSESIDNLKNENDMSKALNEYSNIIYLANKEGLPKQLMVNLMEKDAVLLNNTTENESTQNEQSNVNPTVPEQTTSNNENKETPENANNTNNMSEDEINKLLEESAKRLKEAMDNNDEEAIASERSYRQQLLQQLNDLHAENIRKVNEEKIANLEKLLEESSKRLKEAMEKNDENAIASERSYRQGLISQISNLKSEINLNTDVGIKKTPTQSQPVNTTTPSNDTTTNNNDTSNNTDTNQTNDNNNDNNNNNQTNDQEPENNDINNNEPQVDVPDVDMDNLTPEEIKEAIALLEKRKKAIDKEIIKIDLNAPWDNTMNLMKEYIAVSKEINKLKTKLPIEENINEEENTVENEVQETNKNNKKQRFTKFKKFASGIIYGARNFFYDIKRIFKKKSNTIEMPDEILTPDEIIDQNGEKIDFSPVIPIEDLKKKREELERIKKEQEENIIEEELPKAMGM